MNNDFGFGLLVTVLILVIMVLWTILVYLRAIIRTLKYEIEKLKRYIYELIDSAGRGDN
jgi:predicted Holliday junction resolvase-like endonuclease